MELLDRKTDDELLQTLMAEIAKSNNEIRCAKNDLEKAAKRLSFLIVVINTLQDRQ